MVEKHGVFGFRGYPHTTPGAVLLEVDFIDGPQINARIFCQSPQFFLTGPALQGLPERPSHAACADENPIAGRVVDIAVPPR